MSECNSIGDEFRRALSDLLTAAQQFAWSATAALQRSVEKVGAVRTAKDQIKPFWWPDDPRHPFFRALAERKKLEFSIEYLVTNRNWGDLFTTEECELALERLAQNGFVPPDPDENALVPAGRVRSLSDLRVHQGTFIPFVCGFDSECGEIGWLHERFRETGRLIPGGRQHAHLRACAPCRRKYPEIVEAFAAVDAEWRDAFCALFRNLVRALDLSEERVDKLAKAAYELSESNFDDLESYKVDFGLHRDRIGGLLAWRAVLLAGFSGMAMELYAQTFSESANLWSEWQLEERASLSAYLKQLPDESAIGAMMAKGIHSACRLPAEDVISMPTDGDLEPIDGLLVAVETSDLEDWEEILSEPPKDISCWNILRLAYGAARAELPRAVGAPQSCLAKFSHSLQQLDERVERIEANSGLLLPMMDQMDRFARWADRSSRLRAEESVRTYLGPIYAKLAPQAREWVICAEQIYLSDLMAKDPVVTYLARAFEIHLRLIVKGLVQHLRRENIQDYPVPAVKGGLLQNGRERKNLALGGILKNLRDDRPELLTFCRAHGISVERLRSSLNSVVPPRNIAVHGPGLPSGRIRQIHDEWLGADTGDGGIFAAVVE